MLLMLSLLLSFIRSSVSCYVCFSAEKKLPRRKAKACKRSDEFSQKILRHWVVYSAVGFSWIAGFALSIGITLTTTDLVDGVCYSYIFWSSRESQLAYGIWYFLFFFVIILALFVYCYGRILIIIRRQAKVMAAHNATGSNAKPVSYTHLTLPTILRV